MTIDSKASLHPSRLVLLAMGCLFSWGLSWATTPTVEWVTPPVWLQTEKSSQPAAPGMKIETAAWLVTGRGGRAAVRVETEELRLGNDAVWYWAGPQDLGTGNALQGSVRVGPPQNPDRLPLPDSDRPPLRLFRDGSWRVIIGPGQDQAGAQRISNFMANAGYPVKIMERGTAETLLEWWVALEGFRQAETALEAGRQIASQVLGVTLVVVEEIPGMAPSDIDRRPRSAGEEESDANAEPVNTPSANGSALAPALLVEPVLPVPTPVSRATNHPRALPLREKTVSTRSKKTAESPAAKKRREREEAKHAKEAKAHAKAKAKARAKARENERQRLAKE